MSSLSDITLLDYATPQINRYFGIFIFFFGMIGSILNILVLSQKPLYLNPCARLFLMSSITSIIAFMSGLITRILSSWQLDFSETNRALCKLRGLFVYASMTSSFWLIALATIDRWLSSSHLTSRRRKSTLKNAQRGGIIIISLSIGIYLQILYCFDANLIDTPMQCYGKSSQCRILTDLSFALITILCPLLIMIFFSLMTISNVRQIHHRIHHQPLNVIIQHKKVDRQLLIMLFFQITLLFLLSLPLSIQRLYLTFTNNGFKTTLQKSIDNFIYNLFLLFIYLANGITFYLYTISGGSTFRKSLFNLFKRCQRIIH
ncbi:unnamed protein product [Adineta steineri]|uniref:G-protein coupled receptors family 1 profile domain-containing protein n=1 Tax=Adineta steineri TaxID=433720 RepID=A0A813QAA6_9BILA|nr:unnamed protein product [Adineta steineri]